MLKKHEKHIASLIAKELLEEGMIYGDELEEYVKLNSKGLINFKDDRSYLEFEDYLLGCIERSKKRNEKIVKKHTRKDRQKITYVFDIKTRELNKFDSVKEAAEEIKINPGMVSAYLKNNFRYKQRYIFTRDEKFEYKGE